MEIKFEPKQEYAINNEGLLFDALVDGEKVTCVATREALWEGLSGDQVVSLQAAFEAGQARIQDAARVLIADGVQRTPDCTICRNRWSLSARISRRRDSDRLLLRVPVCLTPVHGGCWSAASHEKPVFMIGFFIACRFGRRSRGRPSRTGSCAPGDTSPL